MLSSKEFEEKLTIGNFPELEKAYQETKLYFENLKEKIKRDEVSLNYPAFCSYDEVINIKLPTYKIRIINNSKNTSDLRDLLKGITNYEIYEEPNVIEYPSFNPVRSIAIHCLESTLEANTLTAEFIEKKLEQNNIHSERCVAFALYRIRIKVDDEGYITVIRGNN